MITTPAWGDCTIISNGILSNYMHELAHCNGWNHPPFEQGVQPPMEYVYKYPGALRVIVSPDEQWGMEFLYFMQENANLTFDYRPVWRLCKAMFDRNGSHYDERINTVIGCASVQ